MKQTGIAIGIVLTLILGLIVDAQKVEAAGMPPLPIIYIGDVTVGGVPAPDGSTVVGKIGDYTSNPITVKNGRVAGLTVGPPDTGYFGMTITFELNEVVVAEETDVFKTYGLPVTRRDFNLTFPVIPTPTPLPTNTPLPTSTPLPATATPVATATPIVVGPVVYSGLVVASGATIPEGALLTARIGAYESNPIPVIGGSYLSLIVDLNDPDLTGATVKFYLEGTEARTTTIYDVGSTMRNVDLIFTGLPIFNTPEPRPIHTPMPTVVPVAIAAPVAPAPATAPAVNTPVATQIPAPTPEPMVLVVTATPETEEAPLPAEESGGCFAVSGVDPLTGTANVLAMIGPLLFLVAYRGIRKRF